MRGTAWANAFQTIVFMALGVVTFALIAKSLGGPHAATTAVQDVNPTRLKRTVTQTDQQTYEQKLAAWERHESVLKPLKPHGISQLHFLTYFFIPLSVGMFPHLFQHWLTAKSAKSFRLAVVAHPLMIMVVWVPCVLIGVWATSAVYQGKPLIPPGFTNPNAVLAVMVKKLSDPVLAGLLTAGILAAIMSSLDSQFLCVGSIFTNDIVSHYLGHDRLSDRQKVIVGRAFVVLVVAVTFALSLLRTRSVFALGVWCFTGFASLFPLVFAAIYWKRTTKAAAFASVLTAAGAWLWLFAESGFGRDRGFLFLGMMPVATIIALSTAALIIVSLITPPPSAQTVQKFFAGPDPAGAASADPAQAVTTG